jgi:WD40 repeat protein
MPILEEATTLATGLGHGPALAWSPDGQFLAGSGAGDAVNLWRVETGQLVATCHGHEAEVSALAWSPDGRYVASASSAFASEAVRFWDPATGRQLQALPAHDEDDFVSAIAFSPDSRALAMATGEVRVCAVESGREVRKLDGFGPLAWSPHGSYLVSGGRGGRGSPRQPFDNGALKVWNVANGTEAQTLLASSRNIVGLQFDKLGGVLVSRGHDPASQASSDLIAIWNFHAGRLVRELRTAYDTYDMALHPIGVVLILAHAHTRWHRGDERGRLSVWEVGGGRQVESVLAHGGFTRSVAFRPDGKMLASGGGDGTVKLWRVTL